MGRTVVNALAGVAWMSRSAFRAVMGSSGSGKSTLLNLIGGSDRGNVGALRVAGQEITSLDENGLALYRQQMCGFIFQSFNLVGSMTALQNVEFPMVFARARRAERRPSGALSAWRPWAWPTGWTISPPSSRGRAAAGRRRAGACQCAAAAAGGRADRQPGFAHGQRDHGFDPARPHRGSSDRVDGDARSGHRRGRGRGDPHAGWSDSTG